jgi:serine/threonine-protein kinase
MAAPPPKASSLSAAPRNYSAPPLEKGQVLFNQYVVERVVGKLGSCVVVKVRHARHAGRFLLKYLAPEACSEPFAVEQFLQTARASIELRSEYTARTVDAGCLPGGLPYLVAESSQGTELREILRVRGALERADAIDAVLQAAHAVSEAHRHGLTHGSLSPSSLFLTLGPEGQPMVQVLDFGSASTLRRDPFSVRLRHWNQGTAIFSESIRLWDTVACTAPERLRGSGEATAAGDVWALGAILYELLLGTPPFSAQTTPALLAEIAADHPRSARELGRSLPSDLERVVLRCLSKSPDARFQSVHELAEALRRFASPDARALVDRIARIQDYDPEQAPWFIAIHETSPAEPPRPTLAPGEQPPRSMSVRQHRGAASLLLAVLGALAGVLVGTYVTRVLASRDAAPAKAISAPVRPHR